MSWECTEYDLFMAWREIERRGLARSDEARKRYAKRRVDDLRAKPWENADDWRGRIKAFDRIAKGLETCPTMSCSI